MTAAARAKITTSVASTDSSSPSAASRPAASRKGTPTTAWAATSRGRVRVRSRDRDASVWPSAPDIERGYPWSVFAPRGRVRIARRCVPLLQKLDEHRIRPIRAWTDVGCAASIRGPMKAAERDPARQQRREYLVSSLAVARRTVLAAVAACGLMVAPAAAAQTAPEAGCPVTPTTTPFAAWGDLAE